MMGPRPAGNESRKEFRLGVYLLHDGAAPRPALLHKARDISAAVAEYFFRATDGSNAGAAESELRTLVSATADRNVGVADGLRLRP